MSKYTRDEFIEKARKRHGDKYDYSQVDYVDSQTKVAIVCHEKDVLGNEHGIFWQMPYSHLQGFRCPRCNGRKKTTEQWVVEAMAVYPEGKYTFEKTHYTHARDKVVVTCQEHGDFETLPHDFLRGHGCPKCQEPKLERIFEKEAAEAKIEYVTQKKFEWLSPLSLDFYIPGIKCAIECQGSQHYLRKELFDKRETLEIRKERDARKRELCKENGIELIYFMEQKYQKYEVSGNKVFTDISTLIDYIKNHNVT